MVKYILQSGGLKNQPDLAKKYFKELLDGLGNKPKLLWCFFATLPDDCDERFEKYTKLFESFMPEGVKPIHENATVENFEKEVARADVVYIHGGRIKPLCDILKKYNVRSLFEGKSVGTNSASSMVLASQAWICDERIPMDGLGIIPIKFLAHFESNYGEDDPRGKIDWNEAYAELKNYEDKKLPIYALREGEYAVFEI